MNLSVIQRMIRQGDLSLDGTRYLLNCRGECEWLDYKEDLHLQHDKDLCDFTRDAIAIKNVGGGYILVGVRDKTWELVGLSNPLPFDAKLLRDQVRRSSALDLDLDIVHHEFHTSHGPRLVALIQVRGSKKWRKRRTPTMVGKDFCHNQPYGIRRGEIYIRKGDSTVRVQTETELEDLLDALDALADEDALNPEKQPSPFVIQDGTYRLLDKGFENFIGRNDLRNNILDAVTRDPRIWIINVHGPGGVGKSALVNWATYQLYDKRTFEGIIHLTAKDTVLTPKGIKRISPSLYSLENLLDHILDAFEEPLVPDLESKRRIALEILEAWDVLLVLDNMETVSDGRILQFLQQLNVKVKAKVLLTSRQKTGGWELPIPVTELTLPDVRDFLTIKSKELRIPFPLDDSICEGVLKASGGLPLAIQWIMGQYKMVQRIDEVLRAVEKRDSPVLEFSFRNIWRVLSPDAKALLSSMTIFDSPPTSQQLAIATEWEMDRIEKALAELAEVTFVTRNTHISDGSVVYSALPITLAFARHQLAFMDTFEAQCRQRLQRFLDQMELQETEVYRVRSLFERYALSNDNEKRAVILCRRGESEMFAGNVGNAENLFRQARELSPSSAYVYAMSASFELNRNRVGVALEFANYACKRASRATGGLCYTILARVHDVQRDKGGRADALKMALEYEPNNNVLRHQFGVALSRLGNNEEAIDEFSKIIDDEIAKGTAHITLLYALKTRIISLRRIGRWDEAEKDLRLAHDIIAKYAHLQSEAFHFLDLEDENENQQKKRRYR